MYTGFKHLHSTLAWVFLAVMVVAIIYFTIAILTKKDFTAWSKRLGLAGLILAHLQLLFGLILYFVSPLGFSNLGGDAMGDSFQRLLSVEHPFINIIAIILITIGYRLSKKAPTDYGKHLKLQIFYVIGLGLILLRLPWEVWP